MPRLDTRYPGAGIDLALQPDGQLVVATVEGPRVRLARSSGVGYSSPAPGGILGREMRIAAADDGRIGAIAHVVTPSQPVVNLDVANPTSLWRPIPGGLFGERYVAIAFRNGWFVWATVTATAGVLRIEDETGTVVPQTIKATSQGILYWADEPILADDRRTVSAGPVRLFHGITIGPYTLGTLTTPADRLVLVAGDQAIPITDGNPSRPRLAVRGTTVYVAFWQQGATLVTLTPPYVTAPSPAPQPPPVPPPTPVPPPQPPPLPRPPEPPMSTLTLRSAHGFYVCAEPDGRLVANREAIGPWETFELENGGDGWTGLKSAHGRYVCAEGGGGSTLVADRVSFGPWERFTIRRVDGGVALETWNGHFVCAELDGRMVADRTGIGPWEIFSTSTTEGAKLRGKLRPAGRRLAASDGPICWRYCSGFTLAHLLTTTPGQAAAYLDWVVARGFTGVRVMLGDLPWAGQTFDSALRGLPLLIDAAARRNLYLSLCCLTDTKNRSQAQCEGHVLAIAVLADASPNCTLELANEIGHPTQASWLTPEWLLRLGQRLPSTLLWGIGAPLSPDEPVDGRFPGESAPLVFSHLSRSRDPWNMVRRVRELYAIAETTGKPVVNNEPIGAGPFDQPGRRSSNPAIFHAMGALNAAFGIQGVFHLDAGLRCTLPSAVETACAQAFLLGHSLYGDSAGAGSYRNTGHGGSPVKSIQNLTRAYSFLGDPTYTLALGYTDQSLIEFSPGWIPEETVQLAEGFRVIRVRQL